MSHVKNGQIFCLLSAFCNMVQNHCKYHWKTTVSRTPAGTSKELQRKPNLLVQNAGRLRALPQRASNKDHENGAQVIKFLSHSMAMMGMK